MRNYIDRTGEDDAPRRHPKSKDKTPESGVEAGNQRICNKFARQIEKYERP